MSYMTPSPTTPSFPSQTPNTDFPSAAEDTRRRSKRESTASATRRREEAANRYPSPPPGASSPSAPAPPRLGPQSIEAQLVIPPFNPNGRRATGQAPSAGSGTPSPRTSGGSWQPPTPQQQLAFEQQQQQQRPGYGGQRPASAAVVPVIPSYQHLHASQQAPPPAQAQGGSVSSRARQSVGYLPTNAAANLGPYPQLYTPHPMPRTKIYFGPYILLQTLGEGEFGKVKLGVHSERWGEDVAIKLIKRGNVDTAQRGEKVRREIDVLKAVRHPNIVRLYDVIETDKYIGIVLEYASGGELFDHILAHRYLKERDAARLFAQLISAVAYLHQKGIVHRDLKLENLLLDRNRNVQVTDFGFANRFGVATVDLMHTSCGSPCYAAPELVVQEGKYVGTAVDVWSCGVILYAMLAGYLPYDDDPANPEGDNINLLYKYILGTKLVFPDWISDEPRELLLMMLVPDPAKRCTIEDVTKHRWLRRFAQSFEKTVDELEGQAQEMEVQKRRMLEAQRQFLINQQQAQLAQQAQQGGAPAPGMTRSSTLSPTTGAARHRSAIVPVHQGMDTMQEEPSSPPVVPSRATQPVLNYANPNGNTNRRSGAGAYLGPSQPSTPTTNRLSVEADPFSFEPRQSPPSAQAVSQPMAPSRSAPPDAPAVGEDQIMHEEDRRAEQRRRAAVEQAAGLLGTSPSSISPPQFERVSVPGRTSRQSSLNASIHSTESGSAATNAALAEVERRRKASQRMTVQVEYDGQHSRKSRTSSLASSQHGRPSPSASPKLPAVVVDEPMAIDTPKRSPVLEPDTPRPDELIPPAALAAIPQVSPISEELPAAESAPPTPTPAALPAVERAATPPPTEVPVPVSFPATPPRTPSTHTVTNDATSGGSTPKKRKSGAEAPAPGTEMPPPPIPATLPDPEATPKAKKTSAPPTHVLGASTASTTTAVSERPESVASTASTSARSGRGHRPTASMDRFSLRSLLTRNDSHSSHAPPLPSPGLPSVPQQSEKEREAEAKAEKRKSRRQKALSLQPFRAGTAAKLAKVREPLPTVPSASPSDEGRRTTRSSAQKEGAMSPPPPRSSSRAQGLSQASGMTTSQSTADLEANWGSGQQGQGKAKAVMDWFRRRSTRASGSGEQPPIQTDFDARKTPVRSNSAAPRVTVAAPQETESHPPSRTPSQAQSHVSQASQTSQKSTLATSIVSSAGTVPAATTAAPTTAPVAASAPAPSKASYRLREHIGAIDKAATTEADPRAVMSAVREALWTMGLTAEWETEFKVKCTRMSRKAWTAKQQLGSSAMTRSGSLAASLSGSPGLPHSPSTGFKSLFAGRRSPLPTSPSLSAASMSPAMGEGFDTPSSSPLIGGSFSFQNKDQPAPSYGESGDQGDEVRFYVELTRVKGLGGLYYLEIKRSKGGAWAFKGCYDRLLSGMAPSGVMKN